MGDIAVSVENVSKRYRLGETGGFHFFKRRNREETQTLWALRDVNFEVKRGEVAGIIGRNGAGKSTLLKVLSRIVEPSEGRVAIRGRVGSLLEVGTGFHPELTGRENVFLNGAILGMKQAEIRRKFDEIVAFAEVERFIDTPVKRYSSGMYTRLAFSVAAHLEPEVLIVDEVLAVGDMQFQKRCMGRMNEVAREGRTVLFVSHNMAAVRALCDTGVLLRRGQVETAGEVGEVLRQYLAHDAETDTAAVIFDVGAPSAPVMTAARLYCDGQLNCRLPMGGDLAIEVDYASPHAIAYPRVGFTVSTSDGDVVINANNRYQPTQVEPTPSQAGTARCSLGAVPLMPGRYAINLYFGDHGHDSHHVAGAISFEVEERDLWGLGTPPGRASLMYWPTRFEFQSAEGSQGTELEEEKDDGRVIAERRVPGASPPG